MPLRARSSLLFLSVAVLSRASCQSSKMYERLRNMKARGFHPKHIDDVGANQGAWTAAVRDIWPAAQFIMVEPNDEHRQSLESVVARRHRHQEIHDQVVTGIVLGNVSKTVTYNVNALDKSGTGNTIFVEAAAPAGRFKPVSKQMLTLDEMHAQHQLSLPQFLKLDTQGAELLVLQGATHALATSIEVVLLEAAVMNWNDGAPLWFEVHAAMEARGFQLYDVVELHYGGPPFSALLQVDLLFVKKSSDLWSKRASGIPTPSKGWPRFRPVERVLD